MTILLAALAGYVAGLLVGVAAAGFARAAKGN